MIRNFTIPMNFTRFSEPCRVRGCITHGHPIYGFGGSRRWLDSAHFAHPQLGGRPGRRRRPESRALPSRKPHAGMGVSAIERAEQVLNH
jgi:hypothetical protein